MRNYSFFVVLAILFLVPFSSCNNDNDIQTEDSNSFSFAFMTDIHLQPEKNAVEGFRQAIDTLNALNPDFVITGGDLVMDVLGQNFERSDSLFNLYEKEIKRFKMPVYNTLGNHEVFGIYDASGVEEDHPEYGNKMYENRLGETFYSFTHKDWKFMIVNSVEDTKKSKYIGMIDSIQIEKIKEELNTTDKDMPIVLSTHIPFMTIFSQIYGGSTMPNDSGLVVSNSKDVIELFGDHNLKLVLQGHLHTIEDIYVNGTHFITGGAVSGRWWEGANRGFEEGFLYISIKNDTFDWEYIDYGWEVDPNIEKYEE